MSMIWICIWWNW